MVDSPLQPFMPTVEITDDQLIRVADGTVHKLVDVLKDHEEYNLWSIGWNAEGQEHGRTFHASHERAKAFMAQQEKLLNLGIEKSLPNGSPSLVEVSEWLYNWVHEFGDFWADFSNSAEAKNYRGPIYN